MKQHLPEDALAGPMSGGSKSQQDSQVHTPSRHLGAVCECRTIEAPINTIAHILENGNIPILNIETTDTDKLDLRAKKADDGTTYVVVWHTVPDGLGSAAYNTITTCQLIRLADRLGKLLVEEIRAELCFWLGTLCIPAGAERQHLRETTRTLIEQIYQEAYAILVVDPQLLRTEREVSVENLEFSSYLASLLRANSQLALNSRILLMTTSGFFDVQAKEKRSKSILPFAADDYGLASGAESWDVCTTSPP